MGMETVIETVAEIKDVIMTAGTMTVVVAVETVTVTVAETVTAER